MNELHLFAGVGGGILASNLLGHNVIGAVEIDEYCCKVLEQRQQDGLLEKFPIFQTDIRDFVRGYASLYRGVCDLVSGGFPCQPFSIAGIGAGGDDERNMWPATIDTIRIIRPSYCFLENVPNLLAHEYFGTILGELSEAGYDAEWDVFSACEQGAPHTRERLFIVAYMQGERRSGRGICGDGKKGTGEGAPTLRACSRETYSGCGETSLWCESIAEAVRMDDGISPKLDRVKACGNAQVPAVAAKAFTTLLARCGR